jgi:hypothetical protein
MNSSTDNFSCAMFATKADTLNLFSDEELKNELRKRGYSWVWAGDTSCEDMIDDFDLGSGL